ncbi:hypothetical protein [Streptomyces sp. V3I7]|uniref:hypothetical protein n=1 Tax=Streptomyces sp. V3I7 TaxID=3042278 RepID=UPI0027874A8D|nr:hypothetical protein [Streptomyces sp. V3I7]MDQ0990299.1 hypothetical protein [Streptomyces sp. V3I7]
MGIRMLHRRTAHPWTTAWADAAAAPSMRPPLVLALAADASTARIPTDLAAVMRTAVTDLRRRFRRRLRRPGPAAAWRQWADLLRGYLALLLTLLPRPRPSRTVTVFVATLTERPGSAAQRRARRRRPDAGL